MTTTPAMPEHHVPIALVHLSPPDREAVFRYAEAYALATLQAQAQPAAKCDGNHGGPRCADPECWNDSQAQPAAESPCACWPGRMCSRSAQCARDAPPAAVSDAEIEAAATKAVRERRLSWLGFKKDDQGEYTIPALSPSDYQFARAILALRPQAVPMTDAWNWLTEANIDAYLEDYEMRGEDEDGRDACYTPTEGDRALLKDFVMGLLYEAQEATHHGITAQAKDGGA